MDTLRYSSAMENWLANNGVVNKLTVFVKTTCTKWTATISLIK